MGRKGDGAPGVPPGPGWLKIECMLKSVVLPDDGAAAAAAPAAADKKKGWNAMALWHDRSVCSKRISPALLRARRFCPVGWQPSALPERPASTRDCLR